MPIERQTISARSADIGSSKNKTIKWFNTIYRIQHFRKRNVQ